MRDPHDDATIFAESGQTDFNALQYATASPADPNPNFKTGIANRNGKASDMLLDAEMKIITLPGFEQVQRKLDYLATKKPEWFANIQAVYAVSNAGFYAAIKNDAIYVSAAAELTCGFSPAKELIGAFGQIENRQSLTFNQEYALETLWHEIWHARTHGTHVLTGKKREAIEAVVQFVSRHSYPLLLSAMGGKASRQKQILSGGIAYQIEVGNFRSLMQILDIDESALANDLSALLLEYKKPDILLQAVMQRMSGPSVRPEKIKRAFNLLYKQHGFVQKVEKIIEY